MVASTIAAISTPPGSGGIGIIKISGPQAIEIAEPLFVAGHFSPTDIAAPYPSMKRKILKPRRLHYGCVIDPETRCILDEVLFVVMPAPYSYTGEDVVEIQAHAGSFSLKSILSLLIQKGARLAEPGEFTKRAFLNGRIDLTQAEAVIDMINACSRKAIKIAAAQISGGFKPIINSLKTTLLKILSSINAEIDFPDDVAGAVDADEFIHLIEEQIIPDLSNLIRRHEDQNFLRDGLKVVIVGGPNVGKSSLLNCLVSRERAIVTELPGTTRDLIQDSFISKGIPVIITDTAGIRENPDLVERIGIEKAWEYIFQSDIIIFTLDAGKPFSVDDLSIFNQITNKKIIFVINKMDLPREEILFSLPPQWQNFHHVEISALYNWGINELKEIIAQLSFDSTTEQDDRIIPNLRQKAALDKGLESVNNVLLGLREKVPSELVAIDLQLSLDALDEILGEKINDRVIDQIFDRFCIGK